MEKLAPYFKAVVGFVAPAAVTITAAVLPGSDGGTAITAAEGWTAACACIITASAVYAVRNAPAPTAGAQRADAPEHRAG